ncbi:hypothetical protein [Streptomyces sp. ISL-94]|uniref:hypothetical protein n=1 Tax=Streptomyces sp. ISL-94 TaxID=2819190 RepID=UPI001BE7EA48|nr:hypothetical protein [Streptomyces sp. ISL-94]MBT2478180.1 hypothetical protein [Streptomyces sp. ISL-94]
MNGPADDTADDTADNGLDRLPQGHPSPELLARAGRGLARFLRGYDPASQQPGGGNDRT